MNRSKKSGLKQFGMIAGISSLAVLAFAQNESRPANQEERRERVRERVQQVRETQEASPEEQAAEMTPEQQEALAELDTIEEKFSYISGLRSARQAKAINIEIDKDAFMMGFDDIMNDKEPLFSDTEMREVSKEISQLRREALRKEKEMEVINNKKAAEEFLAENKDKEGVVTTESGLQYKVVREGEGDSPTASDTVTLNYEGRLINGTVFDSSYKRSKPASFPVNRVIPGWTEGLQYMKPGAEYEFYIPPQMAYGETGRPTIPPNSLLIFKVELLEVN